LSSHHSPIGIEVVQEKVKIYPEALSNTLKSKSIGNEIIPTLLIFGSIGRLLTQKIKLSLLTLLRMGQNKAS
jgi:hypothetical protein